MHLKEGAELKDDRGRSSRIRWCFLVIPGVQPGMNWIATEQVLGEGRSSSLGAFLGAFTNK
jgi:hypothetical protein